MISLQREGISSMINAARLLYRHTLFRQRRFSLSPLILRPTLLVFVIVGYRRRLDPLPNPQIPFSSPKGQARKC